MSPDTKPLKWILDKRFRVLWHISFWFIMYLDEILSIFGITASYEPEMLPYIVGSFFLDIALVYFNFYLLIPHFLLKNKFWKYFFSTIASILLINAINMLTDPFFEPSEYQWDEIASEFILATFIPTLTLLGTAIAVKLFKLLLQKQTKLQEVEKDKLETELAYLKDQVNPHFLFNALNNIYVLSRKRPKEAAESILILSDLLRYQLYDCAKEKVYLRQEIDYIKNYLKLDKIRKNKAEIKFNIEGTPNGKMVAPFMFLPFVENAIKHGLSLESESFMDIKFNVNEEEILFDIKNSKPATPNQHIGGGIGLVNVKRRLKLLYPDKHTLVMVNEKDYFEVKLGLKLN